MMPNKEIAKPIRKSFVLFVIVLTATVVVSIMRPPLGKKLNLDSFLRRVGTHISKSFDYETTLSVRDVADAYVQLVRSKYAADGITTTGFGDLFVNPHKDTWAGVDIDGTEILLISRVQNEDKSYTYTVVRPGMVTEAVREDSIKAELADYFRFEIDPIKK